MKSKYKDALLYVPREHNNIKAEPGLSKTVPGQAFTVKQIKEFMKRGIKMDLLRRGIYDIEKEEDPIMQNPFTKQNLDLTDIDQIKENIYESMKVVDKLRKSKKEKENEAKKAKEKEDIIKEYESKKQKPT